MVENQIRAECMKYVPHGYQILPRILGYHICSTITTQTTLYAICRDLDLARWFIQHFDLNPKDIAEYSIYDIDCTRELLRSNKDAFARIMVGAASIGNLELMKWVLSHTNKKKVARRIVVEDPLTISSWGHKMANAAARGGHLETYKWIYNTIIFRRYKRHKKVIVNHDVRYHFMTEIESAIRSGCVEMIRWIREYHVHDVVHYFRLWVNGGHFFACPNTFVRLQLLIHPNMFMMAFKSGCEEMVDYIFQEAKVVVRSKIEFMEQACLFGELRYVKRMYEELHPYYAFVSDISTDADIILTRNIRPELFLPILLERSYTPLIDSIYYTKSVDYLYGAAEGHADIIEWLDKQV